MTLELVAPDSPDEDLLEDRVARLAELIDYLKGDLAEERGLLQRLLDYLDIDQLELEYFKQTGCLRSYPGGRVLAKIRIEKSLMRHHGDLEEKLAEQDAKMAQVGQRLDELISDIEDVDPAYK